MWKQYNRSLQNIYIYNGYLNETAKSQGEKTPNWTSCISKLNFQNLNWLAYLNCWPKLIHWNP